MERFNFSGLKTIEQSEKETPRFDGIGKGTRQKCWELLSDCLRQGSLLGLEIDLRFDWYFSDLALPIVLYLP